MMKSIAGTIIVFFLVLAFTPVQAQQPAFYNDIQQFRKLDRVRVPPERAVLFIGSSSFTMWKDVQEYFPAHTIINRGFGGSTLPDLIRYADDIVFAYDPKQVVIYCGENDLAASDTVSAVTVTRRFITLFTLIRQRYPKIPVLYISMKPSPSREHLMHKMDAGNRAIAEFLRKQKKAVFVDVYHLMLDEKGKPEKELFIKDMLHMNSNGYAIWQKAIAPYLK
ncbi:MAG: GDSL-type esterase/lipase family protein [Chitinophagaceae bacterium]|nr:GDSL-type esterase/lipase family protein [Chitinophagaceae bacterium]